MTKTNALGIIGSGILYYDGNGTYSNLGNILSLAYGGSEVSSFVAYSPICAGTTAGNPLQSVASVGTLGQVLTSNGPSTLPSFQNAPAGSGYILWNGSLMGGNPADLTTYYLGLGQSLTAVTTPLRANVSIPIPISGTITACYGSIIVEGTTSAGDVEIYLRLNNTTDYTVTTTASCASANNPFNNASMSVAVSAGDFIAIKFVGANWSPNPTSVGVIASFLVT